MNDPQYTKEETSTTPMLLGESIVAKSQENFWALSRVSLSSRTDNNQLDQGLGRQSSKQDSHGHSAIIAAENGEEIIYVGIFSSGFRSSNGSIPILQIEFEEGDQRNPINFSRRKKWAITTVASLGSFLAGKSL